MSDDANFTKFDFDNDFFEVVATGKAQASPSSQAAVPPKARPPRTFKEAEAKGFSEGEAKGFSRGQQQAEAQFQTQLNQATQTLENTVKTLQQRHTDALTKLEHNLLGLLRHSLKKIVNHAETHYTDTILKEHIQDLLQETHNTHPLTLRVHPNATESHKNILSTHKTPITITPDETMSPADCALEWPSGGLDKRLSGLLDRLDKNLTSAGATTITPTQAIENDVKDRTDNLLDPNEELVPELKPTSLTEG